MSDFEKHRTQTDAQRAVLRRRTGATVAEQAIVRHLGIELYKERHQAGHTKDDAEKSEPPAAEGPSGDSADP
ncbi:hypothetical protein [Kribbella sindirgiensis]|uniref:Uncharacterized protein n=1 Tax=Kribbella sindirgiensis TaxID=1124744 RepID=A0A4R0I462_9ACTN|nr:hypothetical protein [Kribbella sindirgiensis]TCC24355.1 hypothetical protein E0H50_32435 [Kribbella sindirgiensis]